MWDLGYADVAPDQAISKFGPAPFGEPPIAWTLGPPSVELMRDPTDHRTAPHAP